MVNLLIMIVIAAFWIKKVILRLRKEVLRVKQDLDRYKKEVSPTKKEKGKKKDKDITNNDVKSEHIQTVMSSYELVP